MKPPKPSIKPSEFVVEKEYEFLERDLDGNFILNKVILNKIDFYGKGVWWEASVTYSNTLNDYSPRCNKTSIEFLFEIGDFNSIREFASYLFLKDRERNEKRIRKAQRLVHELTEKNITSYDSFCTLLKQHNHIMLGEVEETLKSL